MEREIREVANEAGRKDGGPKVLSVGLDVADQESVEKAAGVVEREFEGKVDVLVNNAGYLEEWKAIGESVPEEWWRSWEVVCIVFISLFSFSLLCLFFSLLAFFLLFFCFGRWNVADNNGMEEYTRSLPHDEIVPSAFARKRTEDDNQHHFQRRPRHELWGECVSNHEVCAIAAFGVHERRIWRAGGFDILCASRGCNDGVGARHA